MRLFRNYAAVGVLVTAVCTAVVSAVGWYNGEQAIDDAIRNELVTRRTNRAAQVADQVDRMAAEVASLAADPSMTKAVAELMEGLAEVESALESQSVSPETEAALAEWMQIDIVDPMAERGLETLPAGRLVPEDVVGQEMLSLAVLDRPSSLPRSFVRATQVHGADVRRRAAVLGYDDMLIVDIDSRRVAFSSARKGDSGADLNGGYLRSSGLADVVRLASDGGSGVAVADFSHYLPARNRASAFFAVSMPVAGRGPAALVVRINPDAFNRLLIDARGMAPSGLSLPVQTYVVGADRLLRTDPLPFQNNPVAFTAAAEAVGANQTVLTGLRAGEAALSVPVTAPLLDDVFIRHESAVGFTTDPVGREVLMGAERVPSEFVDWAVVAQIDRSEALEPLRRFAIQEAILGAVVLVSAGILLWLFNRTLFRPRARLEEVAAKALDGDLTDRVADGAGDEISAASTSFDQLLDTVVEAKVSVEDEERRAAAISAAVMPASIEVNAASADAPANETMRVACCLVADASAVHAADLQTVDTIRDAMAYVRSLAVSHDVAVERIEGSSVLVSAPIDDLAAVVAFARDSVAAGGRSGGTTDSSAGLLSAGIGVGSLGARTVGSGRLHIVVWGSAVESAEQAQESANPGQVGLSGEAARLAREHAVDGLSDGPNGVHIATIAAEAL